MPASWQQSGVVPVGEDDGQASGSQSYPDASAISPIQSPVGTRHDQGQSEHHEISPLQSPLLQYQNLAAREKVTSSEKERPPRIIGAIDQSNGFHSGIPVTEDDRTAFPMSTIAPPILGSIRRGEGFHSGVTSDDGDDTVPHAVALTGKEGIMFPGSNIIYPSCFPLPSLDENPSPDYSTYDPNAPSTSQHINIRPDIESRTPSPSRQHRIPPPPPRTPPQSQPPAVQPQHPSPLRRTKTPVHAPNFPPPPSSTTPAASLSSLSSLARDQKPPLAPLTHTTSLDSSGFTPSERAAHTSTLRRLRTLRLLTLSRLFLRTAATLLSLTALILTLTTIALSLHQAHHPSSSSSSSSPPPPPSTASRAGLNMFATFSGITTLLSTLLLLLTYCVPHLRNLESKLSTLLFGLLSIFALAAWSGACTYMHRAGGGGGGGGNRARNIWWWTCDAAAAAAAERSEEAYGGAGGGRGGGGDLEKVCRLAWAGWDLGMVSCVVEVVLLVNVVVVVGLVRGGGWWRIWRRGRSNSGE
ncbi:MAG: hypothetical protein Q9227_006182 [Pyrenula ochraceoflavens]